MLLGGVLNRIFKLYFISDRINADENTFETLQFCQFFFNIAVELFVFLAGRRVSAVIVVSGSSGGLSFVCFLGMFHCSSPLFKFGRGGRIRTYE